MTIASGQLASFKRLHKSRMTDDIAWSTWHKAYTSTDMRVDLSNKYSTENNKRNKQKKTYTHNFVSIGRGRYCKHFFRIACTNWMWNFTFDTFKSSAIVFCTKVRGRKEWSKRVNWMYLVFFFVKSNEY